MRQATEALVQTTWMAEDPIFACHDNVTEVNWPLVLDKVYNGDYSMAQLTLISVFAFLSGNDELDSISLGELNNLSALEKQAILEALQIKWNGVQLQENL
jgi:hypothetical protein